MTSSPSPRIFVLTIIVLFLFHQASTLSYSKDLKIRYFTNGQLICDHPMLNITKRNDIASLTWIFPDASLVTPSTALDSTRYILKGNSDDTNPASKFLGYNLTVLEVNDDVFGYYTCVVVFSSTTGGANSPSIAAIRWGLNVDGADFSELLDNYRRHAIIGGIAAGVVLVLIIVCCLIWYFWCNEKVPEDFEENPIEEDQTKKNDLATFQNSAFDHDRIETQNENGKEIANESDARL